VLGKVTSRGKILNKNLAIANDVKIFKIKQQGVLMHR